MASPLDARTARSPAPLGRAWATALIGAGGDAAEPSLVVFAYNGDTWDLYEDLHDVEMLFKEAETGLGMFSKSAKRRGLRRPLSTPPELFGGQGGRAEALYGYGARVIPLALTFDDVLLVRSTPRCCQRSAHPERHSSPATFASTSHRLSGHGHGHRRAGLAIAMAREGARLHPTRTCPSRTRRRRCCGSRRASRA